MADAEKEIRISGKDEASPEIRKTGASLKTLGVAAAAAAAGIKLAVDALGDAIDAAVEQDAANGRLIRSFRQAGDSAAEAARRFEQAQNQFSRNTRFGVTVLDQTDALQRLVKATDDAEQSQRDLRLAIDIQADGVTDLQGATEALVKVRQGDLGVLRDLGIASKDFEARLSAISDESARAEVAISLIRREFKGAAEETRGAKDEISEFNEKLTALKVAAGEAALRVAGEADSLGSALLKVFGIIDEDGSSIDVLNGALDGLIENVKKIELIDVVNLFALANPVTAAPALLPSIARKFAKEVGGGGDTGGGDLGNVIGDTTVPQADLQGGSGAGIGSLAGQISRDVPKDVPKVSGPTFTDDELDPTAEAFALADRERKAQRLLEIERETDDIKRLQLETQLALDELSVKKLNDTERQLERERIINEALSERRDILDSREAERDAKKQEKTNKLNADAIEKLKILREQRKAQIESEREWIAIGLDGAQQVTGAVIENQTAEAALNVLIEGARAAAAFASFGPPPFGNPFGLKQGAGHLIAAAKFSAAAAFGGSGEAAAKSAPTGGGASFGASGEESARQGQILGDVGTGTQARSPVIINFSSIGRPTPEDARQIAETVGFEENNQV